MVTVYHFTVFDMKNGDNKMQPRKATREAIAVAGGTVVEGSDQEVDESVIDGNGFVGEGA